MKIFGHNQVRNIAIVSNQNQVVTSAGYAVVESQDPVIVGMDPININCVRDIRISKPEGILTQKWEIDFSGVSSTTAPTGDDYGFSFVFKNWAGFDRAYVKHVYVHHTGTLIDEFVTELNRCFINENRESYRPFTSIAKSGSKIVLTESTPKYIEHLFSIEDNVDLEIIPTSDFGVPAVKTCVTPTPADFGKNDVVIKAMYDQFLRNRADRYGFIGYPDINPTEKPVIVNENMCICDIKYYHQDHGMLNQNSEKELTIVCNAVNASASETLAKNIANALSTATGVAVSYGKGITKPSSQQSS